LATGQNAAQIPLRHHRVHCFSPLMERGRSRQPPVRLTPRDSAPRAPSAPSRVEPDFPLAAQRPAPRTHRRDAARHVGSPLRRLRLLPRGGFSTITQDVHRGPSLPCIVGSRACRPEPGVERARRTTIEVFLIRGVAVVGAVDTGEMSATPGNDRALVAHGLRRSSGRSAPVACGEAAAAKVAPGSCPGRAQRVTHLSTGPKGPVASGLSTAVDYLWCGLSAGPPTPPLSSADWRRAKRGGGRRLSAGVQGRWGR
jgi:hypothetical protein